LTRMGWYVGCWRLVDEMDGDWIARSLGLERAELRGGRNMRLQQSMDGRRSPDHITFRKITVSCIDAFKWLNPAFFTRTYTYLARGKVGGMT